MDCSGGAGLNLLPVPRAGGFMVVGARACRHQLNQRFQECSAQIRHFSLLRTVPDMTQIHGCLARQ